MYEYNHSIIIFVSINREWRIHMELERHPYETDQSFKNLIYFVPLEVKLVCYTYIYFFCIVYFSDPYNSEDKQISYKYQIPRKTQ